MRLWIERHAFTWGVAIVVTILSSATSRAAISNGSLITNSVAAEEQRILAYHQAEQSFQEKLKVGKQRYEQKQETRAKVIAAMAAELQARQQTVVIQPIVASEQNVQAAGIGSSTWIVVLAVGVLCAVFGVNRLRAKPSDS